MRSLERGLAVLELLGAAESALPLSTIAHHLALPAGTVHRILRTLVAQGYVEQDPRTRWYQLGLKILQLHAATVPAVRLATAARPHLCDLVQQSGERAHLAVYRGGAVVYIDNVDNTESLARYVPIGMQRPAHASALGKALLAHQSAEEIDAFLARHALTRFNALTITEPNAFRRELAAVRQRGVALDQGERRDDVHCIAAPVFDETGQVVAAISVAGTPDRIVPRVADLAVMVVLAARTASAHLGFRPRHPGDLDLRTLSALSTAPVGAQ